MNREVQLIINSKDRENYNSTVSTDFTVQLQNPINYDILAYGLESCCIPKTSYNIVDGSFELEDVSVRIISIPDGNYSITALVSELQTQMNLGGPVVYTVSYNANTMKLSFVSDGTGFYINPNQLDFPFLLKLGFNNFTGYSSIASPLPTIIPPKVFDISGIKNVYIKISELSEYMRDTKNLSSNFKVNFGCPYGSIVYFNNENTYKQYYTTAQNHIRRTDKFSVRLVDESGELVDLNGSDWSLVLRFLVKDLY